MTRRRAYWTCQLAGWGLYALANGVLGVVAHQLTPGSALNTLGVSALGVAVSHGLRTVARRRGWLELRLPALAVRMVGASVLGAALMEGVVFGGAAVFGPGPFRFPPPPATIVLLLFNWSVLLVGWAAIYTAVHLLWRWQEAERARARADAEGYRLDAVLKEAELRALQAQVNPHFLFNSLNSVRALIAEDPARAQQAVTELTALLRYGLAAGQAPVVPLAEELEAVRAYLALEGVRFEERLRWRVEGGPAAGVVVPPFVVQTLVENAVKHGIGRRTAGGEVVVRVVTEEAGVRITVENTGLLDAGGDGAARETTGVGLANARERLRRLIGPAATLTLEQAGPLLVRAEVFLPAPDVPGAVANRTSVATGVGA